MAVGSTSDVRLVPQDLALARVSPHIYNTTDEMDRLLNALARYARNGL